MFKNWNLSTKIIIAFSALITLTASSLAFGQYWQLRNIQRQAMIERLLEIMQLAAPQIDHDYHSLVVSSKDTQTAYYQINQQRLETIQSSSKDIQHLYTVRRQPNGQYTFVLDYSPNPDKPDAMVGTSLEKLPPLLATQAAILQAKTGDDIEINSAGIPVLYGYAPIKGEFNRLDGILVVELDARSVLQRESNATLIALTTFAAFLLITLGIVWYLAKSLIVRPTLKLNQAAQRLAAGEWDETLPTERTDELGTLARSFNHMAQQLKKSFQELAQYSQNLEQEVALRTQELSESQQLLDLVINNIPQSIFWKNRECVYLGCNKSFSQAAGIESTDIIGKTDDDLAWTQAKSKFFTESDRRVMESNTPELGRVESQVQADGRQCWLETSKVPLQDRQGQVMGMIGISQDITPYKEAEASAQQASQAKSEFLANMSHELRTPLNGILGYTQILNRSKALSDRDREGVNVIHRSGTHLLALINEILDLAKIEARKLELTPTPVHLPSLLQSVVAMCQVKAEQKGHEFLYQPSTRLPEQVMADEKFLSQVLINLLGNAIKFTDTGSVSLKIDVVASTETQADLMFQVVDTGVGIAEENIDKLFEAFEQVGDASKQSEGTGLGLAISQRIVQLMGGTIQVKSQLGSGSEFYFTVTFPLTQNDILLPHRQPDQHIIGYTPGLTQTQERYYTILVVDDRWENRTVVVNLLEPLGFKVIEAEHGQEGLDKLQLLHPDLMITDLVMPGMDGYELLQQIRSDEDLKSQKVIISSASVSAKDQQTALEYGADDFLAKPIDAQLLFQMVSKYLNLEWVYDEIDSLEAIPTQIILPSIEVLEELFALAQYGDVITLRKKINSLVESDRLYVPFAEPILRLTKQFLVEEIQELLNQHLEEKKVQL